MASKRIRLSSGRIKAAQDYEPVSSRAPRNAPRTAAAHRSSSAPNQQLTGPDEAQENSHEPLDSQPATEHYFDASSCWDDNDDMHWSLPDVFPPPSQRTTAQRNASAAEDWEKRREEQHYTAEWPCETCETIALRIAHAEDFFQHLEQRAAICPCCGSSGDEYPIQREQEVLIVMSDFSLRMALPVRLCSWYVACT